MENWDDYRFILALDRAGTIRSAAELLGVNHSTVSRRLAVISDRCGDPIFERVAAGYRATILGNKLVEAARQIEEIGFSANRAQRASIKDVSGPITLSLPGVLGQHILIGELARFCQEYPEIQLSIQSTYHFANLDRSEADIVIRSVRRPPEHLVGRRLFPYGLCYYCSVDYLEKTAPDDRQWITNITEQNPPAWISETPFPHAPVGLRADDIMLRHEAAINGHGMIRTACYIADPDPLLVRLPKTEPTPAHDLWVLTHPDLKNTPRIKLLMRVISSALLDKRDLIERK